MSKEQKPELTAAEIFTPEVIKEIAGDDCTIEVSFEPPTLDELTALRDFDEWYGSYIINKMFEEQKEAAPDSAASSSVELPDS